MRRHDYTKTSQAWRCYCSAALVSLSCGLSSPALGDDYATILDVASGGVRYVTNTANTATGLPNNSATKPELEALPGGTLSENFFNPAMLGYQLAVCAESNALRRQTGGQFTAGLTDDQLYNRVNQLVGSIEQMVSAPNNMYVGSGKKLFYQVYRTATGIAPLSTDFERTVPTIDNGTYQITSAITELYLRQLAGQSPQGVTPAQLLSLGDRLHAINSQISLGLGYDGYGYRTGGPNDPRSGGRYDRIPAEWRVNPIIAMAQGDATIDQTASALDFMFSGTKTSASVERLPVDGTALGSYAATALISSERTTIFGRDTIVPLIAANIQVAQSLGLPAAGATGIATGLQTSNGFSTFGLSPHESLGQNGPPDHLDSRVLVFPAAGMMLGSGSNLAVGNLVSAVNSAKDAGLWHSIYGLPNSRDFDTGFVSSNPIWGTLETQQSTAAVLNYLLGGSFLENTLRTSPQWNSAINFYDQYIDRRLIYVQGESVDINNSAPYRINASDGRTWRLGAVGAESSYVFDNRDAGKYRISFRQSNFDAGPGDTIQVFCDGILKGTVTSINTHDWEAFVETSPLALGPLAGGTHEIRLRLASSDGFGWELDRILLEKVGDLLVGDYNFNGVVDAADYTVWRKTVGTNTNLAADGDRDGDVDNYDYAPWRSNFSATEGSFGNGLNAGLSAVPEPASHFLVMSGFGLVCVFRLSCRDSYYAVRIHGK